MSYVKDFEELVTHTQVLASRPLEFLQRKFVFLWPYESIGIVAPQPHGAKATKRFDMSR